MTSSWTNAVADDNASGPVIRRRPLRDSGEMDITPMIDITFLLLIFFLVASTTASQTGVELPKARYGKGVDSGNSTIITVAARRGPGPARVYLGDGTSGTPLADDPDLQHQQIAEAVREGFRQGKANVLVKAERSVAHHDVAAVSTAAAEVEGIKLHLAVLEKE